MHLLQLLPPCTQRPLWPKVSLRLLHSDPHHTCAHRMKSPHPGGIQRKLIRREFHTDQVKELITQTSNLCAAEPFYLFILHLFSLICCFPNHPDTSLSPLCLFPRHSSTFYHVSSAAAAFECISWDRCKGSRYYRLCHACRVGQVEEWCNWKEHWHWQVWWGWNLWLKMKTFAPSPQQNAIHPQSCSSPKNKHGELQPHLTFLGKYSNFILFKSIMMFLVFPVLRHVELLTLHYRKGLWAGQICLGSPFLWYLHGDSFAKWKIQYLLKTFSCWYHTICLLEANSWQHAGQLNSWSRYAWGCA